MLSLVIFDWKRTLYNPDINELIAGTEDILLFLKSKKIPMSLIGKGGSEMKNEVERFRLKSFFKNITFVENEKSMEIYKPYVQTKNPKDIFFVGDRVRSELEAGNRLGATTVWVKQGKFANELPQNKFQRPDFIVTSLAECLILLEKSI